MEVMKVGWGDGRPEKRTDSSLALQTTCQRLCTHLITSGDERMFSDAFKAFVLM